MPIGAMHPMRNDRPGGAPARARRLAGSRIPPHRLMVIVMAMMVRMMMVMMMTDSIQ